MKNRMKVLIAHDGADNSKAVFVDLEVAALPRCALRGLNIENFG